MKSIKFLMATMLIALCVSFVSCSDKDEPQDRGIIGEWAFPSEIQGNERRVTFRSDGTFYVRDFDGGVERSLGTFNYVFDVKTSTGKLLDDNGVAVYSFKYINQQILVYNNKELFETYNRVL